VLLTYVVALRLEPFESATDGRAFGSNPFPGLNGGSLRTDALMLLEKIFLYGGVIFLLGSAMRARWPVTVLLTATLIANACAETYRPGRSSEITDALLPVLIAAVFAVLPYPSKHCTAPGAELGVHFRQ
jgi:hypothetical protein